MSSIAAFQTTTAKNGSRLGPAEVEVIEAGAVHARRADGHLVRAELALAFSYEPAVADTVLLISDGDAHYVIGVLAGRGRAVLTFPGDVELRSTGGSVRVAGAKGVDIEAPAVSIRAEQLSTIVDKARHVAGELYQTVFGLWHSQAERVHSVASEAHHLQAKQATITTSEDVTINGKTVHLG